MQKDLVKNGGLSRRTIVSMTFILLVIPFTLLGGIFLLDHLVWNLHIGERLYKIRYYYLISLLIILYATISFLMAFEGRRPQARELVVLSVLSAIAVAGRAAFFMVPQFKPVAAVVILAGICFGPESGFLVGVVSGFVSNFFFGQGPWTPWQMFSFGIIGFLAGILFQKGVLPKKRIPLCIYGGLAVFLIYGPIMNTYTAFITAYRLSWQLLASYWISGIPFDLVHAAATVFFLYVLAQPMVEKLDRIKIKYGLVEKRSIH